MKFLTLLLFDRSTIDFVGARMPDRFIYPRSIRKDSPQTGPNQLSIGPILHIIRSLSNLFEVAWVHPKLALKHSGWIAEYDRKRTTVGELRQLTLHISDEASATRWIRQQLQVKPQSSQDLQPQFMQHMQSWAKHEQTIELSEILELNFFCYDGSGAVPSQIKAYLSSNFRELRKLGDSDPSLQAKATDRWYVPNPNKAGDLEKLRRRTLLKEFDQYRAETKRKIKQFRSEAVRAGFEHCYNEQDYETIVTVAAKLPTKVVQEDETLLMYYDVAAMRLGVDS